MIQSRSAARSLDRVNQSRWRAAALLLAGTVVYLNSFTGVFLFDDRRHILSSILNPFELHRHKSLWEILTGARPFLNLTFALNHVFGGLNPWGYHLVNLAIHLLAALTLFGILRRTLENVVRNGYSSASFLAFSISLLWLLHPLQTQSVTYIVQRAESMMGLFYLLALYGVIRGVGASSLRAEGEAISGPRGLLRRANRAAPDDQAADRRSIDRRRSDPRNDGRVWHVLSVLSCALGMMTKEVMVTAPVVILLYDRIFLASSFKEIWNQRKFLYFGLFAAAAVLGPAIFWLFRPSQSSTVGFGLPNLSPLDYALSQPGVILHYLKLSFWPHPLVIDYAWPVAKSLEAILFPSLAIGALLVLTLWALRVRPPLGFLGIWFFLILAPTSSVIPIADLCFEHRMYLPLASVMTLAVLFGYQILKSRPFPAKVIVLTISVTFGILTLLRNQDYQSEAGLWQDTVKKRPGNWRGYGNLGTSLLNEKKLEEALVRYREALRINPNYALAHYNIATILDAQGKLDEAVRHYEEVLRINPADADAHSNLGTILAQQGKADEAISHYLKTLELNPNFAEGYYNLGNAYLKQGEFTQAVVQYSKALQLKPGLKAAQDNLKRALAQKKNS